jgi:hypothetical protein
MSEKTDKLGRTGKSIGGRPKGSLSKRSLRQNKQKAIADLFGPIVGKAITKASQILDEPLDSKVASGQLQLSAAKLIIEKAIELNNDVYKKEADQLDDPEEDEQPKDVAPAQKRFSTKVVSITKSDE